MLNAIDLELETKMNVFHSQEKVNLLSLAFIIFSYVIHLQAFASKIQRIGGQFRNYSKSI